MSKGPTPRHSKSPKPVTIDLDATDVTPKTEDLKPKPSATGPAVAKAADKATDKVVDKKAAETAKMEKTGDATAAAQPKTDSPAKPGPDTKAAPTAADTRTQETKPKPKEPGPASAKPAAPGGKSGGGGLGMIASGLLGAVIALGGGYALQMNGMLPAPGGNTGQVEDLSSRMGVISSDLEKLRSQVAESTGGAAGDVSARLDSLEKALADTAAGIGGDAGGTEAMAGLTTRIGGLESKIAELGAAGAATATDPALVAEVGELRAAQTGVQTALSELRSQAEALASKIAGLEDTQAQLSQQIDAPARQIDLARAIAAAGLKSAIDRGGSFMSELEAFASVAPDDPAVAELRDLAARGVPSRSGLVAGFSDAAGKAIAAAAPTDPEAGLVDRLMSSALSVVKVRKVGDVEGDSAEAIVARAEARLANGDLDAAVAEWSALPEASRAATAEYGDALAARARAEKLIAAAMAPTGAPTGASSEAPSATEAPAN